MEKLSIIEVLNYIVLPLVGTVSWFFKRTVDRIQDDVELIKKEYLHKDDFRDFKNELRSMFEEIRKDIRELHAKS